MILFLKFGISALAARSTVLMITRMCRPHGTELFADHGLIAFDLIKGTPLDCSCFAFFAAIFMHLLLGLRYHPRAIR